MEPKLERFLEKYEALVLILLLGAVLLVNVQGIAWGLPGHWDPDELGVVVSSALDGLVKFDQTNFDYPSLPKYVMLFIGRVTDALGYSRYAYLLAARFFSVFLGGMVTWLAYGLVRQVGGKRWSALLAAVLVSTSSELALNSHFAHNDLYVTFFAGETVYFVLRFMNTKGKGWLYAAFFTAGLTASSKYNGGMIVLLAMAAYALIEGRKVYQEKLRTFETVFVGAGLSILGYGVGTYTALASFSFYIKRLLPALWRHANYNRTPTSQPGLLSQWAVMQSAFGDVATVLFLVSVAGLVVLAGLVLANRIKGDRQRFMLALMVVGAVIALDLPILASFNVQARFFLPLLPLLAVTVAVVIEYFMDWMRPRRLVKAASLVMAGMLIVVGVECVRLASVGLTIQNDARIPAGRFIATLPGNSSIEFTLYTPNIDESHFLIAQKYPLFFLKFKDQELPTDSRFVYNTGEQGIENRKPDYLVISSIIYMRFKDAYICQRHQEECDFFKRLLAGETNYRQIADFQYKLPRFFPGIDMTFINPEIKVYERIK